MLPQVLYDQLDYFLDCDDTLKGIVYADQDSFEVMDQFVPPTSLAPKPSKEQQDEEEPSNSNKKETILVEALSKTSSSATAVTGNIPNSKPSATKRKNRKTVNKNKKESSEGSKVDPLATAAEEIVAGLLASPPPQNVEDELTVISAKGAVLPQGASKSSVSRRRGKKKKSAAVVVVPPDMLSECSDVSDAESVASDNLDIDTALEDRNFFNAQRKAAAAKTGKVDIVDISHDPALVQLLKDKENTEAEPSIKVESKTQDKKRISTAERLFGDKLKQKETKSAKESKVSDLLADIKLSKDDHSKTLGVESTSLAGSTRPLEVKEKKVTLGVDSGIVTQHPGGSSPRFMVSPYNQQVNYSPGQVRAENNWLNHPMLNNFSNAPPQAPSHTPNRQQQQQQHHDHRNRQQNNKHQSGGGNRQHQSGGGNRQQQGGGGKGGAYFNSPGQQQQLHQRRTVPTVAQVMRLSNWSRYIQKVGYVVHILESRNTRLGAGTLKPFADMNRQFALFSPNDGRIPRMKIPMAQCPTDLFPRRQDYAKKIYLAKITKWTDFKFAIG